MRSPVCSAFLVFAALGATAHEPVIVAPGEGRMVPVPFHESKLLLSEDASAAGISVYEFVVPPRTGGAPPHEHGNEDEFAYVLDGILTLMLGDRVAQAGPGTLAALTRGTVHAFWNASDQPVRALFFVSEGGFEQFFDEVAVMLREEMPESPDQANARIGAIAAEHGIAIRPELIPAEVQVLYAPK